MASCAPSHLFLSIILFFFFIWELGYYYCLAPGFELLRGGRGQVHIAQTLAWLRPEYLDWITGDTIARLVEKKPQGWCIAAVGLRIRYRWQVQTRNPAFPISPYVL